MAFEPYLQLPETPDEEPAPQPNVRQEAAEMLQQSPVRPRPSAPGGPRVDDSSFFSQFAPPKPTPPKEGILGGVGRAIAGGAAELGHQITGLAAYAGNELAPDTAISRGLNWANETAGQSAQDWQESMTPQDRDLMARQWTSLDPHQTIWQGGAHDFVHALALQMGQAAPSTLAMLLPMGVMAKAGMMNGALAYVGATQAGLSMGSIANNIQQEIASRDNATLRQQSPKFAQMLDQGMDPQTARQQLTQEASRYAPVVGGLISGAIATLAGRYLTPVLTGQAGAGVLRRAGLGFLDQAAQGAGVGATDYIARETAAHTYDSGRAPDLVGGLKAAGEAAASQGALGAGLAVAHGRSQPFQHDKAPNQPENANTHSTMAQTPENKATGVSPEEHVTNMHADETPITRERWDEEPTQPQQPELTEQQQLPLGPAQDMAAAIRSHYDRGAGGDVGHWGAEDQGYRGASPPEPVPQVPNGMQEANGPQGNLDLRGGQMNPPRPGPTPPVPAPAQLNLPLRRRARGGPEQSTVADQLRAGVTPQPPTLVGKSADWNQPDLFRDQPTGRLTLPENRPTIQGNPEAPGARPFSDIQGQLHELTQGQRAGVWLDGDTMASLRRSGLLDRVREQAGNEAVPLVNFDGRGGTLLAKDQATADELTHYRDAKVGSVPEIIQHATGESGAPVAPAEVLRRAALTNVENEVQQRAAAEKETARAVSQAAEPAPTVADRLRAAAARDLATGKESPAISREEAARRITAEAQRVHNEAAGRAWAGTGAPDPRDIDFHDQGLQGQYENLDHELAGMRVMRNTASTPEDVEHARAGEAVIERRMAAFLKAHPHESRAEQVAKAAVRLSPEAVREFAANKRAVGRQYVRPTERIEHPEVLEGEKPISRSAVRQLPKDELEHHFNDAVQHFADKVDVGRTPEQLREQYGKTRSEMEKLVNRYNRERQAFEARGSSYSKSDKMAVSPREALTERQREINRSRTRGQQKIVGYKTFNPEHLMATIESQREMEMNTQDRAARIKTRAALKDGMGNAIKTAERAMGQLEKVKDENLERGGGAMARGYLRQITQYGRALRDGSLKGSDAMAAAKQFIAHVNMLAKKDPVERAQYLVDAYNTELKRQQQRGAGANPSRLERMNEIGAPKETPEDSQPDVQNLETEQYRSSLGYPQKPTAFRGAAEAIAHHFENEGGVRASAVIREVLKAFPEDHPMAKLFRALQNVTDQRSMIGYKDLEGKIAGQTAWTKDAPTIYINRNILEKARAQGENPAFYLLHTIGHELVHVATARAIEANPHVRARLEAILQEVQQHPEAGEWYGSSKEGIHGVHEMVAEAYSNERFQRFLDSIKLENQPDRSLWQRFKDVVADILGFRGDNDHYSALDAIMREHGTIFKGKTYHETPGEIRRLATQHLETDKDGSKVGGAIDRVMKSVNIDKDTMTRLATDATQGAGQFGLSAMTPRQQSAQFSKYFERANGDNPYRRYWDTFFKRAADNALSMERVGKLSNHWSNLEEKYGIDNANKLSSIMARATTYEFHPDLPASATENSHVGGENLARAAEARKEFQALPEEVQAHYGTMRKYYAQEQRNTTDQLVLNGLHAMLTKGDDAAMSAREFDSKYSVDSVRKLGLDTEDGLQKEFGDKLSGANQGVLAKIGKLSQSKGPYFPLMRNGDYVVTAKRQVANKEFDTSAAAQAYVREQRTNDPTLQVSVSHDVEDGVYRVNVNEREVRMGETKSEAAQHRKELAATYGDENVSPVQLKADLYRGQASITTGSALDSLVRKLEGNPAAQSAVKDFYLRSLGESSFRKRELARANVRGAPVTNQHRSFAQYGRSQSYYLSQLKWGRHLANAQGEVNDMVRAHRDETQVSAVRMGEFARELALRDKISQSPYEVSDLVKKGTSLTQFYMLTSPSHWFVRAAQPYMLTAPWLGARHGMSESMDALVRAQKAIANPLLKESVESGLGLKALFSRAAAEKTYSVIDQVMAHLEKNGADPKINAMIQHLRNNNLIDLSMATELSDISKGKSTGLAARVLDAGRTMLHIAEVNNRVMTAIAARELGLKQGMTEDQAVEHAADAINVTHNDYSYGNTPRLFMAQAKGVLGGARPLMFQFMKYPQQVYGMMISSGLAALRGKTAAERSIGLRTLTGVLATHMLAAGAIGASIQPMKWALGGLMAGASALGLTDQPYTVASALSGDTYDHELRSVMNDLFGTELGELVSKGLPAAVGLDLSQRMALGSTYQFHLKTDSDASTLGSLMETFGGPWLNVAENFYDAGKSFVGGQPIKAIQQMSPHILRDLVKAGAMGQQGVQNNAGTELIPANKLSGPELFAQALGFRPEAVSEIQDRNNAERTALQNIQDQRKAYITRYTAAEPNDREAVRADIRAFNQTHPGFALDYATLQRAVQAKALAKQELEQYGVRLKGRQLPEISASGSMYNTQ
jgi:Large polyvalent protein associated domain 39